MFQVTEAQLLVIAPRMPKATVWAEALSAAMGQFLILTLPRSSMFLAQLAHESSEFRAVEENLRYSDLALMRVWPQRFPTAEIAKAYAYQQSKIANRAYADSYGNGDEASGDGWRYRGRGPIQLTFKANYQDAAIELQLPLVDQPDLVLDPKVGALVAGYYWKSHGCNELADGGSDSAFNAVTQKINAASLGLESRRQYWRRAYHALRNVN